MSSAQDQDMRSGFEGRRITLVISSLGSGGAERVMSILASAWAARGAKITLITLSGSEAPPFYPLDPAIDLRRLDVMRPSRSRLEGIWRNAARVLALRAAIASSRAELVISFIDHVNVLAILATRGLGVPIFVSERVCPGFVPEPRAWTIARALAYLRADRLIVQTREIAMRQRPSLRARTRVVPNPIPDYRSGRSPGGAGRRPPEAPKRIVAAGRLVPQKGFDLLVEAFARIAIARPGWELWIYGEGPERASLEAARARLGLRDRVHLPGVIDDLPEALRDAEIFALSSRFEGFPNALAEAMSSGLACVSFRCPTGPDELIRHRVDGLLVPAEDTLGLATALGELMDEPAERARLAARAPEVSVRFGLDVVLRAWEATFDELGPPLPERASIRRAHAPHG
ncbi:MAG: glycosyltransferase family 4 protein [Myxococcales bacterium]|nr:glycosyltransferase family 4 protein [Myxococcales bacterium]